MSIDPRSSSREPTSLATNSVGDNYLNNECFSGRKPNDVTAVGGGDPYAAELNRQAQSAVYEARRPDLSTYRPPGFESASFETE